MGWEGLVGCVGQRTGACRGLLGKPEGKKPLESLGIDGRLILKSVFKK
jgi:hypothetical protein